MKLLLDENLPVKLKFRFLDRKIETFTVTDMKWKSKSNGELLQLMIENDFTHLVTLDNNLSFQQNFLKYLFRLLLSLLLLTIIHLLWNCLN